MDAIELRNPYALESTELQLLLKRAVEAEGSLLAPAGFESITPDLVEFVTNEHQYMIVGAEEGHFKTVVLGVFPSSHFLPYPTVILFYSEGSKALRERTKQVLLDTVFKRGYTAVIAVNGSNRPDRAWEKVFGMDETTLERRGSLYKIDIK